MSWYESLGDNATSTIPSIEPARTSPAVPSLPEEGRGCSNPAQGSTRWLAPGTAAPEGCQPLSPYRGPQHTDAAGRKAFCCPDAAREQQALDELGARRTRWEWAGLEASRGVEMWQHMLSGRDGAMGGGMVGLVAIMYGITGAVAGAAGGIAAGKGQRLRGGLIGAVAGLGFATFEPAIRSLVFGSPYHGPQLPRDSRAAQFAIPALVGGAAGYLGRKKDE